jgi:MoxR-like ATPase
MTLPHPAISSPAAIGARFAELGYLPDEGLSVAMFLSLQMGKPLLLEGAPGVGKTDAAKTLAMVLGRDLIRLQCYEGIDAAHALYEWNYPRQLLALRQGSDAGLDLYSQAFLIERPLLKALRAPDRTVLLIDEIDRSDQEFEAFLLEFLSDFQISIPELGTLAAAERPPVVLTSNRTRNVHEALRRRCIHHWIPYPTPAREAEIIQARASDVTREVAVAVARAVTALRQRPLVKPPSIAEAVDWARAAMLVGAGNGEWPLAFRQAIGAAIKDEEDLEALRTDLPALLQEACG